MCKVFSKTVDDVVNHFLLNILLMLVNGTIRFFLF